MIKIGFVCFVCFFLRFLFLSWFAVKYELMSVEIKAESTEICKIKVSRKENHLMNELNWKIVASL